MRALFHFIDLNRYANRRIQLICFATTIITSRFIFLNQKNQIWKLIIFINFLWINFFFINNISPLLLLSMSNSNEHEVESRFRLFRFRNILILKFSSVEITLRKTLIRLLKIIFSFDLIDNIINFLKISFFRFLTSSTFLTNLKLSRWEYRHKIFSKLFVDHRSSFSICLKKTLSLWKIWIFVFNFESNENVAKKNWNSIQKNCWIHSSFRQKMKRKKLIINLIYI